MEDQDYVSFEVPASGFEWAQPPLRFGMPPYALEVCTQEPALVVKPSRSRPKPRSVMVPNKLFLDFAQLDPTSQTEILEFANRYGWLGAIDPRRTILPLTGLSGEESDSSGPAVDGEMYSDWSASVREMRRLIEIWQAIKTKDVALLADRIRWAGPRHLEYVGAKREIGPHVIYDSETVLLSEKESELEENDVMSWAFAYLIRTVNKNLINHVTSCLRRDPKSGRVRRLTLPTSLNGALWNQLATAIDDFASIRPCDECHKPMIIDAGAYRASRRTCSNACRIRIYDARKRGACQMYNERVSLKDIAIRLDTTVAQIKKWTQHNHKFVGRRYNGLAHQGKE
jgi:hypothetical protein